MRILSIETSCDETGLTILEAKGTKNPAFKILADSLASQVDIHKEFGGVYPMLAKREHIKNLPILLEKVLKKTKLDTSKKPVDLIAVTYGPGLEPALWTGIVFAKELALKWGVPVIGVNHMEGHILSVFGKEKGSFKIPKINFPAMSLLVSGGHTELVLSKELLKHKIVGETLDDAAGEAFDKVARMLGLPYPGGPEISKLAELERQRAVSSFNLPRPMLHSKNFDFSFSGLKTAVLYLIKKIEDKEKPLSDETKSAIALEFENAVIETLVKKTQKAAEKHKVKTIIVAGGVAANKYLRKEIGKAFPKNIKVLFPEKRLSTDNSIMIGMVGYLEFLKKKGKVGSPKKIKAEGYLRLK
jgi:N6-L-threonylcarbamoyladenine synthase